MTSSEYKYEVESARYEITHDGQWVLSADQFQLFADMARHCKSGSLVLENWKIFLGVSGDKSPESYFEWWNEYKPYETPKEEVAVKWNPKKPSPFDAVKKIVRME